MMSGVKGFRIKSYGGKIKWIIKDKKWGVLVSSLV